ncbi:MAG: serine protease AprX [Bacteroidia bacterium]
MKLVVSFIFACLIFGESYAKTEYHFFVQFYNKGLNYADINKPELFLSERALNRRKKRHVLIDSLDLPVTASYVFNITKPSIKVRYVSKWLNGAVITTESMDTAWRLKIKFFVDDVVYLGKNTVQTNKSGRQSETEPDSDEFKKQYGDGYRQLEMLHGTALHKYGFRGEGMRIAIFDAGFRKVNELSLFKTVIEFGQILYTNDLVDQETNVYDDDDHGLHVFGCMAANKSETMIGSAPSADYLLFRTESNKYETWLEELNWVRAAEIADSMGVDVINSSLGYNTFDEKRLNHTHKDLDGKTTYISRGAGIAATRGILVVNSAGNDGNKSWGTLDFPADVEDILVVGAINHDNEAPAFSSPGPTADFRLKPDVSALGQNTFVATTYGVGTGNGTSYSSPIIAGLATCLWQADPALTPLELKRVIIQSSHLSLNPDNALGHGLPNFDLALMMIGNHPNFDYTKAHVIDFDKTEFEHLELVNLYVPGDTLAFCDFKLKKRFLFVLYNKTMKTFVAELDKKGFGKLQAELYNIPEGKEIILSFYRISNRGDKVILKVINGQLK